MTVIPETWDTNEASPTAVPPKRASGLWHREERPRRSQTELESRAAKAGRVHRSEARKERAAQRENLERPSSSSQMNNGQVPVGNKLRLVRGNSHQGHTRPTNQTRKPHS